jgi:hypothetical protein
MTNATSAYNDRLKDPIKTFLFTIPTGIHLSASDYSAAGLNSNLLRQLAIANFMSQASDDEEKTAFAVVMSGLYATKNIDRLEVVVRNVGIRLKVEDRVTAIIDKIRNGVTQSAVSLTASRLSSAFPDFGAFGVVASTDTMLTTFRPHGSTVDLKIPTILAFPQSIQLDLDTTEKILAAQYNLYYWMRVVKTPPEVEGGPDFNIVYHATSREDMYALRVPQGMIKMVQSTVSGTSTPAVIKMPSPLRTGDLFMYMVALRKYLREGITFDAADIAALVTSDEVGKAAAEFQADREVIKNMGLPASDLRRDGGAVLVSSDSDAFSERRSEAKMTRAEGRSMRDSAYGVRGRGWGAGRRRA